jgi:hypothetical protein
VLRTREQVAVPNAVPTHFGHGARVVPVSSGARFRSTHSSSNTRISTRADEHPLLRLLEELDHLFARHRGETHRGNRRCSRRPRGIRSAFESAPECPKRRAFPQARREMIERCCSHDHYHQSYGVMSIFGYRNCTAVSVSSFQYGSPGFGNPSTSRCRGVARSMKDCISGFSPICDHW